jgi:phage shock protein PspC (stress-responsive transcriptional regulator)
MKKNISINLQGIIFHLEDDGYEVLSRYLHEVKVHFASYQGHDEIVADIEGRIAELFSARLSVNKQVITLLDVEEMTAKMGRVSDFATEPDEDDQEPYTEPAAAGQGHAFAGGPIPNPADTEPRRLYRDLAHRKIAGVAAGLAQYFRVNPLVVRLIFLALVLLPNVFGVYDHIPGTGMFRHRFDFGGLALIAYIVLWVVLPKRADAPAPIDTLDFGGKLTGRKLFRDTDTGKVGGVAAGLAAYFQTDIVLIRVLFLLGAFATFGSTIVAYLILWAVVPEARTVSEKMQMRGDAVTLSGIDNNLRSNAFDGDATPTPNRPLGTYLESAARQAKPAVSFLGTLIRWAAAAILIFMGGSLLLSVLGLAGAALGVISSDSVIHTDDSFRMGEESFNSVMHNVQPWGIAAATLALGIPALALLLLGVRLILRRSALGRTGGLVLLALWLLGLVGAAAAGGQIFRDTRTRATYTTTRRLAAVPGPGIVLDSHNMDDFMGGEVDLDLAPADSGAAPYIEEEYLARGRTQNSARLTAQQSILYNVTQRDSTLTFDQGITLRENAPYRGQKLSLTLHLPLDKTYRLTPSFIERLDDEDFTNDRRPSDDQTHRARLTRDGKFACLDCPASDDDDSRAAEDGDDETVTVNENGTKLKVHVDTDGDEPNVRITTLAPDFNTNPGHYGPGRKKLASDEEFSEIEVHGAFQVVVRQGDGYKVEAAGRTTDLDDVRLEVQGDRLLVRNRNTDGILSALRLENGPVLVQVTVPRLRHLKVSGACQADVRGFRDEELRLEASSASVVRLDVNVPRLDLDLSSASQTTVQGSANELTIDGSSASQVEAAGLRANRVTLDLSSGSQAKVHAVDALTVDLSSGSLARYSGSPREIKRELSSGSTLERL